MDVEIANLAQCLGPLLFSVAEKQMNALAGGSYLPSKPVHPVALVVKDENEPL